MTTIHRRKRHHDESDAMLEHFEPHPKFSHASMAWVAIGTAVLGAGASIYGANKQSKSQGDANAANRAAIEQADRSAWNNYLMQRGLYGANAASGVIPDNARAVNTRLPLWANVPSIGRGGVGTPVGGGGLGDGAVRGFRGLSVRGQAPADPGTQPDMGGN